MNTNTKNTETEKKTAEYENVKQLNSLNQPGSQVSILMDNIKDSRRKMDSILNKHREFVRAKRVKIEEENAAIEKAKAVEVSVPVAEAPPSPPVKEEVPVIKEIPKTEEKVETPVPKKDTAVKTNVVTREKQIDNTPSYIRGRMTPPTPIVAQPRPPQPPRYNNYNNNNQQGSYNNNNNASGSTGFRPQNNFAPRPNNFAPRPGGAPMGGNSFAPRRPSLPKTDAAPLILSKERKGFDPKKKEFVKPGDDKKAMTKRTLIRKGFIQEDIDDERMGTRKLKNRKIKEQIQYTAPKIEKAIITTENLTVKILSEKIGKTAQEIIKQLMVLGIMTTINSVVDFPTMELVANELGVSLELKIEQTKEEILEEQHEVDDMDELLEKRPPIITVMGHVDHGKTSLLDAIRKTSVVTGEAGGITQHIGAYSVLCKNEKITFLDTPGHEAFTEMRARGAKVTDIAILVVAADDGVMPQTVEAINHAKSAGVPIIVAINKVDKPAANIEKIKQALTEYNLVTEEWGGDTMMVPLSAKTGAGVDKLLETILFLAEYNGYKANPSRLAKGSVIEAKLDKGKGPIANIIVQNGTLKVGDFVVSGVTCGRVRAMVDDKGRNVKEAGPSCPVSILGFTDVPNAGEKIFVVTDEKIAKQVIAERTTKIKNDAVNQGQKVTLDDVFNKITEEQIKDLNVVIKADVQGSVEALKNSLMKLNNGEAKVNVIHGGVGTINKSDLMLADVSNAIIVGFNVRPDAESKALSESTGVDIRLYHIIYEVIDDIESALTGMLKPKYREIILGKAQVRSVFKVSNVGTIAGSYVLDGKITRNAKARVFRNGEQIFEGEIASLKRFKDDVKEVATGYECGISVVNFTDLMENDEIQAYVMEVVKQ